MKTLFIDTHFRDILIVLYEDGKVVDKCEVINKKNNSEFIFPSILKVIDGKKINQIIVVTGPGSFTGVRLGVTIAKTFAYTLNIPIKTITALECLAVSSEHKKVAIDDENGYYIGYFGPNNNLLEPYRYVDKETFAKINVDNEIVTNIKYNLEAIYNFVDKYKVEEICHLVKPIYVKKIGVEND